MSRPLKLWPIRVLGPHQCGGSPCGTPGLHCDSPHRSLTPVTPRSRREHLDQSPYIPKVYCNCNSLVNAQLQLQTAYHVKTEGSSSQPRSKRVRAHGGKLQARFPGRKMWHQIWLFKCTTPISALTLTDRGLWTRPQLRNTQYTWHREGVQSVTATTAF